MNDTTAVMQSIARTVDTMLNHNNNPTPIGFVVLVFPPDEPEGARTNYVFNCRRQDIVVAMKEIVARFEGQRQQSGRA